MDRRARSEFERSRQTPKAQSRIADYINGKISLDQMVPKDRIIKPEERHNKRAFLPHINDQVKIIPRKIRDPKTIEVKIDTRRPVQRSKTKIREYNPLTQKFCTPEPREKKKQVFSFDFDDCYVVINKNKKLDNAIEFKHHDNDSTPAESQAPTPSTQSPCNDLVPIISNVNNTLPDTSYYEETLITKNDEISMLKEKIRNMQKNTVAKNSVHMEDENVLNKILQSLTHISNAMKLLKTTDDRTQIVNCVTQMEQEQDKWYSYATAVSEGMKTLKDLNTALKTDNTAKATQLQDKQLENEHLRNQLDDLKNEAAALKNEKRDYSDMLNTTKHALKLAEKDNETLREQLKNHQRLGEKASEELNMLNKAYEKVLIDLQNKEKTAIEVSQNLHQRIAQLEAANADLLADYQRASEEMNELAKQSQHNASAAKEVELRYKEEIETLKVAKEAYIETLRNEAQRLKDEINTLEIKMDEITRQNDHYHSLIAQLTSENQTLRDDSKYMNCERKQLNDAISEWCKSESVHDSVNLIEMIDNLKMRMVIAETNYSNRLMENLEQTVKFTHLLNEQLDR